MILTASGCQIVAGAQALQDDVHGVLTADWTDAERVAFAHPIRRLLDKSPDFAVL